MSGLGMEGAWSEEPMLNGLIDPQAIHYLGGSQGGIMGATTLQAQVAQLGKADELLVGLSGPPRADWSRSSPADIQPDVQAQEVLAAGGVEARTC